jgi:GNAT superfamily N-acetyltransferase
MLRIEPARTPQDYATARRLFAAYAASLEVDTDQLGFAAELADVPGQYQPPQGDLLLARVRDEPIGCVALRPSTPDGCCEMKRLFVTPEGRGTGAGLALAEAVITLARDLGYRRIQLDSLASMHAAQTLYRRLGFDVIAPYYEAPFEGTTFMGKRL